MLLACVITIVLIVLFCGAWAVCCRHQQCTELPPPLEEDLAARMPPWEDEAGR